MAKGAKSEPAADEPRPEVVQAEVVKEGTALAAPAEGGAMSSALSPSEPVNPGALLRFAIERNVPVESMERLVGLAERMSDRAAAEEFSRALAKFQSEVPPISKSKKVDFVGRSGVRVVYAYAPLDAIVAIVRPRLTALGLAFSWDAAVAAGKVRAVCTLRHVAGHRETSTFEAPVDTGSKMNDSQQVGAALTYAKRYALIDVLGIVTVEKDTDGAGDLDAKVTPEQAANLRAVCEEVGGGAEAGLVGYVAKIAGRAVATIEDIPEAFYRAASTAIEAKRRTPK